MSGRAIRYRSLGVPLGRADGSTCSSSRANSRSVKCSARAGGDTSDCVETPLTESMQGEDEPARRAHMFKGRSLRMLAAQQALLSNILAICTGNVWWASAAFQPK